MDKSLVAMDKIVLRCGAQLPEGGTCYGSVEHTSGNHPITRRYVHVCQDCGSTTYHENKYPQYGPRPDIDIAELTATNEQQAKRIEALEKGIQAAITVATDYGNGDISARTLAALLEGDKQ